MVEDRELPFPESVAASEFTRRASTAPRRPSTCSTTWVFGAFTFLMGAINLFAPDRDFFFRVGQWARARSRWGRFGSTQVLGGGRRIHCGGAPPSAGVHRRGYNHRAGIGGVEFFR